MTTIIDELVVRVSADTAPLQQGLAQADQESAAAKARLTQALSGITVQIDASDLRRVLGQLDTETSATAQQLKTTLAGVGDGARAIGVGAQEAGAGVRDGLASAGQGLEHVGQGLASAGTSVMAFGEHTYNAVAHVQDGVGSMVQAAGTAAATLEHVLGVVIAGRAAWLAYATAAAEGASTTEAALKGVGSFAARRAAAGVLGETGALAAGTVVGSAAGLASTALVGYGVYAAGREMVEFGQEAVDASHRAEDAFTSLHDALWRTYYASGQTTEGLVSLERTVGRMTLIPTDKLHEGVQALLQFRDIAGDTFTEVYQTAAQFAQATGTDFVTAVRALAAATRGSYGELEALGVQLNRQQRDQVAALREQGDVAGANAVVLQEMRDRAADFGGAIDEAALSSRRLETALDEMLENVGGKLRALGDWLRTSLITPILTDLRNATAEGLESFNATVAPTIDNIERRLNQNRARLAAFQAAADLAVGGESGADEALYQLRQSIARDEALLLQLRQNNPERVPAAGGPGRQAALVAETPELPELPEPETGTGARQPDNRDAERRQQYLDDLQFEVDGLGSLTAAYHTSEEAVRAQQEAQDLLNAARRAGIDLDSREGEFLRLLIGDRQRYNREIEASRDAVKVREANQTPGERFDANQQRLDRLLDAGALSADDYSRAVGRARLELYGLGDVGRTVSRELVSGFDALRKSGGDFGTMLSRLGDQLANLILQKTVTDPLGNAISGLIGGIDFGDIFDAFPGTTFSTESAPIPPPLPASRVEAFADGGLMTARGRLPLATYADGGVANSPQVALFGEGSVPEAYVPVPSGRIPVELRGSGGGGGMVINITHNIDARGADRSLEARLPAILAESERRTIANLTAQVDRGGSLARTFGRRQ